MLGRMGISGSTALIIIGATAVSLQQPNYVELPL
jgi:hypothetical protein